LKFLAFTIAVFKTFPQHFGLFKIWEILDSEYESDRECQKSQYHSYLTGS